MDKIILKLGETEITHKNLKKSLEDLFESVDIYKFSSQVNSLFNQYFIIFIIFSRKIFENEFYLLS